MSLSTYADWKTRCETGRMKNIHSVHYKTAGGGSVIGSYWRRGGNNGTATIPSTAVVPARTDVGGMEQPNATNDLYLAAVNMTIGTNSTFPHGCGMMLVDRLSHQGGLSGTTTGAQTTNLPTAALTRYTSGVGVIGVIDIYSAVGNSGATMTVDYVDQDGNSATSPAFNFGISNYSGTNRIIPIPMADGDYGIRSISAVTLSGSTGTAGNFGVALIKPLAFLPVTNINNWHDFLVGGGCMTEKILDDAHLHFISMQSSTNPSAYTANMVLIDC